MTDEIPRRFKERSELTMDEEVLTVQAARRGDAVPKFETDAYRQYRAEVLREGGFIEEAKESEPSGSPRPLEEQSVEEHFERLRSTAP